jgi:hypothetical protein
MRGRSLRHTLAKTACRVGADRNGEWSAGYIGNREQQAQHDPGNDKAGKHQEQVTKSPFHTTHRQAAEPAVLSIWHLLIILPLRAVAAEKTSRAPRIFRPVRNNPLTGGSVSMPSISRNHLGQSFEAAFHPVDWYA